MIRIVVSNYGVSQYRAYRADTIWLCLLWFAFSAGYMFALIVHVKQVIALRADQWPLQLTNQRNHHRWITTGRRIVQLVALQAGGDSTVWHELHGFWH